MSVSKQKMTSVARRAAELDAESIAYYRRNPCIACEDLLGIKLTDAQKYILQSTWNASRSVWTCSRNFGKSFLGAILMLLKALLYENQAIYIVSSVGPQTKETFQKIEEICMRIGKTSASINSLKDIAQKEVKAGHLGNGFSHDPISYKVEFYNGSAIYTLNSNPDNNRSRRATLVFFDEAAYCSDELIAVCEAFATQSTDFVTDIDGTFNIEARPKKVPTQLVYASSQGEMTSTFYRHYKSFAKNMLLGNRDYFVCDMTCDVAINVYMEGKPFAPLLTRDKVEAALRDDRAKALREYYNKPQLDGGVDQIVKWGTIRRNERQIIPYFHPPEKGKMVIAFDPSRTMDNSIVSVMNVYKDKELGWVGDVISCENMIDTANSKKYKLDSGRQIDNVRNTILTYNGKAPDYEYIDSILIDQGAGGGGTSTYADGLLKNWKDSSGVEHHGLIDAKHEIYKGYDALYPDAIDKLRLISPRKFRTQMVEEFIELMDLGVIRFPYEWNRRDSITVFTQNKNGEEDAVEIKLDLQQQVALAQIDLMKAETAAIHKTQNAEKTTTVYALAKDKQTNMHDDRWYTLILMAHRLYELRRKTQVKNYEDMYNEDDPPPMCISEINFD